MKYPKNKRQVRKFLGGIHFYRKFFNNRSHIFEPLTYLTGNVTFKWTNTHHDSFEKIKSVIAQETMLCYPNYDLPFLIFTDVSDKKLCVHAAWLGEDSKKNICNSEEVLEKNI